MMLKSQKKKKKKKKRKTYFNRRKQDKKLVLPTPTLQHLRSAQDQNNMVKAYQALF
jgi:hypothetical protein